METSSWLPAILENASRFEEKLPAYRDIVLANVVFCGEKPSPTFQEEERVQWLTDRFTEGGLDSSSDEVNNVTAILPGTQKGKSSNILLAAHLDTLWDKNTDHHVSADETSLSGRGLADNALGVAAMVSLPGLLEELDIQLKSNLILLGASRSLGRGDLEGIRFFLENTKTPIDSAVCVEGTQLGRLSFSCLGMMRGEITVQVPEEQDWKNWGSSSALVHLHRIIGKILAIPRPEQPRTQILLGSMQSGSSFNRPPQSATLRFEVRSESSDEVQRIQFQIEEILKEIDTKHRASAKLDIIAQREPGDLGFSHPLVRCVRDIMETLEIDPRIQPSTSELAALLDKDIPSVTLGLTQGDRTNTLDESIQIAPLFRGLAQLIATLQVIDNQLTHEQS